MKIAFLIDLSLDLLNFQILVKEKVTMIKKIKRWKTKNMVFTPMDKREVQILTHTIILPDIICLSARKNTLKDCQMLRKKFNNRKRSNQV